jgi:hypothetical protein
MVKTYFGLLLLVYMILIVFIVSPSIAIEDPVNLALEKPVTGSGGAGQGTYELLTDGNTATDPYLGGPTWVQVDLKHEFMIDTIKIWHYYGDGRTYHDNKIALSLKGDFLGEETVVFDSNVDGEYPETAAGKTITFKPIKAQYIRAWLGGNTVNAWSHWVELQAFLVGQLSVESKGKLPAIWGKIKSY